MSCRASKRTQFGLLTCCLSEHGPETWHRIQWANDGAAYAVEWGDDRRRVGFADLNGLQTVLSATPTTRPAEVALALSGWLAMHPEVHAELRKLGSA